MQPRICNLAFVLVKATLGEKFAGIRLLSMIVYEGSAAWLDGHTYMVLLDTPLYCCFAGICLYNTASAWGRPEPSRSSFQTSVCRSISALRSGIRLGVVEPSEAGERRNDTELESLALIADGILLLVEPAVETDGTIIVRGSEFISLLRRSHASQSAKSTIQSALMALLLLCNFKDRQQSTTVMPIMVESIRNHTMLLLLQCWRHVSLWVAGSRM